MPGLVPLRRSRSYLDDEDEDEDEGDIYNDDHAENGTSLHADGPNKRIRLGHDDACSHTAVSTPSPSLNPPQTTIPSRRPRTNSHQAAASVLASHIHHVVSEHKPGSIVRVTLTNFVTYTAATFYPGPALNMVIGPNGTGKSTLVCAICLGLGWGPKHLGRAKDSGEFVKHGSNEATIEIELKGQVGKRNPVVRRQIKREGNKSSYYLNGDSTSQSNILSLARSFGIQVDNLCHFLPQDRVVEFAGLSPVDRLESTQRAAAPEYMVQWHEELKKLRIEQKSGERLQAEVKHNLTSLEGRQNLQRADVERIRERELVVERVANLEKLRPLSQLAAAELKFKVAKEQKRTLQNELALLKERDAPLLKAVTAKQDYKLKVDRAVSHQKIVLEKTRGSLAASDKKREDVVDEIASCGHRMDSETKEETERKKQIAAYQTDIRGIEKRLQDEHVEDIDYAAYQERVAENTRQSREVQQQVEDAKRIMNERKHEIADKTRALEKAQEDLRNLSTQAGQQLRKLNEVSKHTVEAWTWVLQNRDKLRGDVFGPPLLECSISDKRFVNQLEMLISNASELCAITCTSREDFTFMDEQFSGVMKLQDVFLRQVHRKLEAWQRPNYNEDRMANLGLEGWAIDYITGPEPVLSMLCAEARLHVSGVSSNEITQAQYEALSASDVTTWVTKGSRHSVVKRREYAGAVSTAIYPTRPAKFYTNQSVDVEAEGRFKDMIVTLGSEKDELSKQNSQASEKIKALNLQIDNLKLEHDEILAEKLRKIRRNNQLLNVLPGKLKTANEQLQACMITSAETAARIVAILEEKNQFILQKGQLAIDYANQIDSMRKLHLKFIEARITQIEATSDFQELSARNVSIKDELDAKRLAVEEADKAVKNCKANYIRIMDVLKKALERDPGLESYIHDLPEEEKQRTPEELELEIESQKARLELLHEGDPRTVREYEARAKEIERLQRQAADHGETLATLDQSIAEIRGKWEPELEVLIEKISEAFSSSFQKINCAGSVSIHKEGDDGRDFEGWAIHISVKFREGEELSLLDSHRQSGGERAVSTIFYLMALQSLSRAPFRVVDEINQGMDPRNERMVHERMVDIACGSEVARQVGENGEELISGQEGGDGQISQYFLITPKLLSDLKYKPGMKVHCIASGEFMPSDYKLLDFKKLLVKAKGKFGSNHELVGGVGA